MFYIVMTSASITPNFFPLLILIISAINPSLQSSGHPFPPPHSSAHFLYPFPHLLPSISPNLTRYSIYSHRFTNLHSILLFLPSPSQHPPHLLSSFRLSLSHHYPMFHSSKQPHKILFPFVHPYFLLLYPFPSLIY